MSATAPAKTCIHCGQDCSGKPRTKDAQGRYACKECHERALAAAKIAAQAAPHKVARPASPPPQIQQEEDALHGLEGLEEFSAGTKMCSGCGAPLASDAAICVACGLNQATGQYLGTSTLKPPKVKKERAPREGRGGGIGLNPVVVGLGLTVVFGLLMFPALGSPEMFLVYALVIILVGLPTTIGTIVCAFKDGFTGWGIVGIVQFLLPCLGLAMLYFIFCVNQRPMIKALNLALILGWVGYVIAAMQHGGLDAIANG